MPDAPAPKPKTWVTPQLKAAAMAHFFPGAGQLYNKEFVKAGIFVSTFMVTIVLAIYSMAKGFYVMYGSIVSLADPNSTETDVNSMADLGPGVLLLGAAILIWLVSIWDAYKIAKSRPVVVSEVAVGPGETRRDPVLPEPPPVRD